MNASPRLYGLDTLRALAIALVFFYHYMVFVSRDATFGVLSQIGWVGVDLFFALSGYLIGNQLLGALRDGRRFSLAKFYARRALRTLPNYYVILALFALWPAFRAGSELPALWKFLTFTQNYELRPGTAFSHAWSLCIEEQFYLLLPAVMLLIAALRRSLAWAWLAVFAALGAGMATRAYMWTTYVGGSDQAGLHFMQYIYYSSFCRSDELVAGVAIALVKNHHPALWSRWMAHGRAALLLGAAGTLLTLYLLLDYERERGYLLTVWGFPMLALSFSLLIVAAVSPASPLCTTRIPGAASLALWSYALYLTHKSVCVHAATFLATRGIDAGGPAGALISTLLSLLAGYALYKLVESPFMALRERWVPSYFAAGARAAAPAQASPAAPAG